MAISAKTITLTNTSTDEVMVDPFTIVSAKKKVKTDLKNIIDDLTNISKHYATLRDHKATKGNWKTLSKSCVKKCNSYKTRLNSSKTSIENKVDDAVQSYVLTMITELKKSQTVVDSISGNV